LPESFAGLTTLRELHLRNTGLREMPITIRTLTSLNVLDLRGNQLVRIPEWLADLPDLVKLDLRWNRLGWNNAPPWMAELSTRGCRVLL
jgi:Leucine-rich repeat (LRR) protein